MKTYSKSNFGYRAAWEFDAEMHFKNLPNEIYLSQYLENKEWKLPVNFIAKPYAIHFTALSDIMKANHDGMYIVSEKMKLLLEEFDISNIDFYIVPLYIGKDNSKREYDKFSLISGNYYLMHVHRSDILDLNIDFDKSEFRCYYWEDDYNVLPAREIKIANKKMLLEYFPNAKNKILPLFSEKLVIDKLENQNDILFFDDMQIQLHYIFRPIAISNAILAEFKKRKFKGILESKPVIFSQV